MAEMGAGDVVILVVAGYVAIVTLVRLMCRRRDAAVAQWQAEVAAQVERKRAEKRREQSRSGRGKQTARAAKR